MKDRIGIGICGLGTVGGGTFRLLRDNGALIARRVGVPVEVVHVASRNGKPDWDIGAVRVSDDIIDVARDPAVDILVELIGGTGDAEGLLREALSNRKHVVTANKALIAEQGNGLFDLAAQSGVSIAFEAAVAGGIPVIKALREGLAANRVQRLAGIINGTGNFILSKMQEGQEYADALAEAQANGYAEADPAFDVDGTDAAHKLAILAAIAFNMPLHFDKVMTEGIFGLSVSDMKHAEALGYRIKHLGIARQSADGIEMRVHPTLIPLECPLADVNGVTNAVLIESDAAGPTLYCGAGAGAEPTASAVVADIVDIARHLAAGQGWPVPPLGLAGFEGGSLEGENPKDNSSQGENPKDNSSQGENPKDNSSQGENPKDNSSQGENPKKSPNTEKGTLLPILAASKVMTGWYLRLVVSKDTPDVLSEVEQVFNQADIGIAIQQPTQEQPAQKQPAQEQPAQEQPTPEQPAQRAANPEAANRQEQPSKSSQPKSSQPKSSQQRGRPAPR